MIIIQWRTKDGLMKLSIMKLLKEIIFPAQLTFGHKYNCTNIMSRRVKWENEKNNVTQPTS